ncbi:MAG: GNAT family N-acetyltransferase [Spirochaetia bacterium]|nr:GNAT family N-acetyltransferase [Spirochaetia bacterium]
MAHFPSKEIQAEVFTIRKVKPSDLKNIVEIENKSFNAYPLKYKNFWYLMKHANCDFIVVEVGSRIVGYAITLYKKNISTARIYSIAVDPDFRNRSFGDTLLVKLQDLAVYRKCNGIRLEVDSVNLSAIRFYEKNGFQRNGEMLHYYGHNKHALRFFRKLP